MTHYLDLMILPRPWRVPENITVSLATHDSVIGNRECHA